MEAILFDLDGTLIDSGDDLAASINYMLKKIGRSEFKSETIKTWVGNGASILVKRALSGGMEIKDIDENEYKKAYEIFMEHYRNNLCVNTKLYPGAKEILEYFKYKKKAIITNKPYEFVSPILKEFGIEKYFELILGGDSLSEKKPSPLPLLVACESLGVSKENVIMVGDSKNDILAAKAAGIKSAAITHGYSQGVDIKSLGADFVINDLYQLKAING